MNCIQKQMAKRAATDAAFDGVILALWGEKLDTFEIARSMHERKSFVANRLAALRDAGRP